MPKSFELTCLSSLSISNFFPSRLIININSLKQAKYELTEFYTARKFKETTVKKESQILKLETGFTEDFIDASPFKVCTQGLKQLLFDHNF